MFNKYTTKEYSRLKGQNNIMILIGNGFDIQAMQALNQRGNEPTYQNFYKFLEEKNFNCNNVIFKKMIEEKESRNKLWSDFELLLIDMKNKDSIASDEIEEDLAAIQREFALFLNERITPEILYEIGEISKENMFSRDSLSKFVDDLSSSAYQHLEFFKRKNGRCEHYMLWNFLFVNFNYTALLDNYIYPDKKQFYPEPYSTVDTNFGIKTDQQSMNSWMVSGYVNLDIIHPHGRQEIVKSMIFGIDNINQFNGSGKVDSHLTKPYWVRNDLKYKNYFRDANLFIIYGHSMGKTDQWWWNNIIQALNDTEAELIIYRFTTIDEDINEGVWIDEFVQSAQGIEFDSEKVSQKIFFIPFNNETKKCFLNTNQDI